MTGGVRLHGWCERCHKVRRVTVYPSSLALLAARGLAVGVCDECEDDAEQRRRR